jgi:hypothetical protein
MNRLKKPTWENNLKSACDELSRVEVGMRKSERSSIAQRAQRTENVWRMMAFQVSVLPQAWEAASLIE